MVLVYTRFERADGHVVEMYLNSGAGQSMFRAPGNAYSPTRAGEDLNNEEFARVAAEHMWERVPSGGNRGWWRR